MNDDPRIDPADLRNVRFPGSSRRYDARSVDQFLETVAARIAATNDLVDELRRELFAAQEAPAAAEAPPQVGRSDLSTLDDDELVRLVGEETASVLSTARRAAEEIRSKAEESAARMIREATAEADRTTEAAAARATELTSDAEHALERATAEAEAEAARIRQEAEEDAERRSTETQERVDAELAAIEERRAEADAEAERIRSEARDEGRGMVAEAKEVRHRILEDLQRRRDLARDQIERLLDGRERLLAAYDKVRENLDDITGQLVDALPHPDEGPEPELPDGFVGVVGGHADEAGADAAEAGEVVEPDDTVAPSSREPDDAVEPDGSDDEADADAEAGEPEPDAVAEAEAEADGEPEPVTEGQAPTETEADEAETASAAEPEGEDEVELESTSTETGAEGQAPTETEADEAEQHEEVDAEGPGGVDALFARLRAEREQSVAKAQEVLEAEAPVAADVESPGDVEAPADEEPASEEPAEEASDGGEPAGEVEASEGERAGDVDRVPPEFLADEADLVRRAEALGPIESRLTRALKRRLSDEQNELLDLLRRSGATAADELLPAPDAQIEVWAGLATKHLAAAASAGAAAAGGGDVDVDVDVSTLAQALGAALAEPFRRRVERSAVDVGGDPDELDERLRALYREWKVQHIGPVAEDTLLSAYALGTLTAAEPDGRVRWRIDPAQGPCPDAQDNALEGALPAGEAFPTGDRCPQAHPGCRCLLVVEPAS